MLKKDLIKIEFKKPNLSFSDREKYINTEIQRIIDNYNSSGYVVLEHKTLNKSGGFASVEFSLKKMVAV
jgi:hypothetical protein